jgi:ankyrin repeat protein
MNQKQGPSLTPEGIEKSPKGEDKKLEMSQESKQIRTPSVPEKPQSSQQISKEDEWVINEGLFRAVDSNDIEAVKLFLDKGAKINAKSSKGDYILMQAYKPEMVRLLLDKGANVNAKTSNGWTVLMSACSRGSKKEHIEIVRLLLDKGADVNAKSTTRGTTPLMLACDGGGPIEVIKLLLDRGAKANAKDNFGNSALGKAGGRPEVLDLLKAHGVKE